MASPRIPISWLLLLVVLAVFGFFGYHILKASSDAEERFPPYSPTDEAAPQGKHVRFADPPPVSAEVGTPNDDESQGAIETSAPIVQRVAIQQMPHVPGQTEADLREHEPLQRSPPTTEYGPPEHTDPLNRHVHMSAEFGSNFRHPEQMIEAHPPMTNESITASGLGGGMTAPGPHNISAYRTEMTQNGAEMLEGIFAYDSTAEGSGYSML